MCFSIGVMLFFNIYMSRRKDIQAILRMGSASFQNRNRKEILIGFKDIFLLA